MVGADVTLSLRGGRFGSDFARFSTTSERLYFGVEPHFTLLGLDHGHGPPDRAVAGERRCAR